MLLIKCILGDYLDSKNLILCCILVVIGTLVACVAAISTHGEETQITVLSNSTLYKSENVSIQLTTVNGTPLANQSVNVTLIDSDNETNTMNLVTNSEGRASFELGGIAVGNYTVECVFGGSDGYVSSNATATLEIKEEIKQETTTATSSQKSTSNGRGGPCPHGYSTINECPTCYNIVQVSEWAYLDPSQNPSAADGINTHNQIRQEAIKKRAELGI